MNRCGTADSTDIDRRLIDDIAVGVLETYNIDRLKIETRIRTFGCKTGSKILMSLTGMTDPDVGFAKDKLLG